MKITKAVIPVAGKGTRFLPATKNIPKEMIPLVDKPMIQYVVEEAVLSGITEIIFVTSSGKGELEDYFDRNLELEGFLNEKGKSEELDLIQNIGSMVNIISVRQKEQLGLGHAILCAEPVIGDDNFVVLLGDDLTFSGTPVTKQLIEISNKYNQKSVIGVMEVPNEDTKKYGIVDGDMETDDTLKMRAMVEKPEPSEAPTNLATPGRYVLTKSIFDCLRKIKRGAGGEYQLTDAINMLATSDDVYAHKFEGKRYDTGSVLGYLNATIDLGLMHEKYGNDFKALLESKKL